MSAAVPRETIVARPVRPLMFRKYLADANLAGAKDTTRRVITEANSTVTPGQFGWVDLETGRSRPKQPTAELRAQCTFPSSGRVRVVSVLPLVRAGDLFWVKVGRYASRARSEQTLEVLRVRVARVQDITEADALREGVQFVPDKFLVRQSFRDAFGKLWDDINGGGSWAANPWVWVYEYKVHTLNIDRYLEGQS